MTAETLIQIGGQTVNASSVTLPATGREFRGAWQLNGSVVEVDMAVARDIKINKLVLADEQEAVDAERDEKIKAAKGDSAGRAAAQARKNRFRGIPAQAAQNAIANAATPDALDAVTLDDFLP